MKFVWIPTKIKAIKTFFKRYLRDTHGTDVPRGVLLLLVKKQKIKNMDQEYEKGSSKEKAYSVSKII